MDRKPLYKSVGHFAKKEREDGTPLDLDVLRHVHLGFVRDFRVYMDKHAVDLANISMDAVLPVLADSLLQRADLLMRRRSRAQSKSRCRGIY